MQEPRYRYLYMCMYMYVYVYRDRQTDLCVYLFGKLVVKLVVCFLMRPYQAPTS